ncbi:hypothetical protein [Pseudoalteromonas fuliginea]|uniref:hypothetical protein n=1 Tax=Pseudoalteromonas fuliginea TaxID=1872678 RepID=UPI00316D2836
MKNKYYIISCVDEREVKSANNSDWPKLIAYSFESHRVLLQEGCGHGLMGGAMSINSLILDDWIEIFQVTNSKWFFDKIESGEVSKLSSENQFIKLLNDNKISIKIIEY